MSHKILVVDDHHRIRAMIRSSIEERTDWIVYEAEHGKIAVLMVATHKPHLVMLDLVMPIMNGIDAAHEISKISPGLPMIMFSLYTHDTVRELAYAAGIKHIFSKEDGMGDHVFDAMTALLHPQAQVQAS
jgi:DNA-binding NarL/FixJ family response regulator